ncbi:MAG: hypothetical protein HQK70_00645 [Desulfamplus sp.]|nr:hypothetical protein [Desulfamplus sp.]
MDYQLFRNILSPYLVDNMSGIQDVKKYTASLSAEDAFDKKFLTVLNNIINCLETCEAIKSLALNILEESDFFSDTEIHKTTKSKYLDKILSDSDYIEHTKSFNLSVIQTYVEKIIHKQLYEINIKIEENQRSLNKLEVASGRMREEVQQTNQIQQASQQAQALQKNRPLVQRNLQPDKTGQSVQLRQATSTPPSRQSEIPPQPTQNPQSAAQVRHQSQEISQQQPQELSQVTIKQHQVTPLSQVHNQNPQNVSNPQSSNTPINSSFLLVEMDQQQCAITYSNIVEILKFDKPVSEKVLRISSIPHNKLVGFARGSSVLRKVNNVEIDKKKLLNNMNVELPNQEAKRFAVIINKEDDYKILFVDYIVYAEPVDGQELGDYVKTVEGEYKIIN